MAAQDLDTGSWSDISSSVKHCRTRVLAFVILRQMTSIVGTCCIGLGRDITAGKDSEGSKPGWFRGSASCGCNGVGI